MSNTKSPDSAGKAGPAGGHNVNAPLSGSDADDALSRSGELSRFSLVAGIGAFVLLIDQVTKIWAASALVDRDIDLFWTARFNLTRNFGSAFGLGASLGRWLSVIIVAVVIGMLLYARTITDRRMLVLFGAITGGAIGNLVDRLVRAEDGFMSGGVIDFIDFQWWPIFNVADIAVVCGAIGLMLLSLREPVDTQ